MSISALPSSVTTRLSLFPGGERLLEEHAAELAQGPEAAIGNDPLASGEGETHGTDADAGDYLLKSDEDGAAE